MRAPIRSLSLLLALCGACESAADKKGGTVQFTASGEVLALGGYAFPPAGPDEPAFVDGWEVRFDSLIVTLDRLTLSENPDRSPTDQSQTDGPVAQVSGPWAVDLHQGGPLLGKGGSDERAVPLATLDRKRDGQPFDETRRYAFGFDVVPASDAARRVNLTAQGQADYAEMVRRGFTVLYTGTATFKGTGCKATSAAYDFTALPRVVKFRLGFAAPTSYVNCQNPDNDPAQPLSGEEHQRGVQIKANAATVAQATIHTDHPFWQTFEHDAPAHFDALAARAQAVGADQVVTLDDLVGVDFTAFADRGGQPLPWRSCVDTYTPPNQSAVMGFDSQGIPRQPGGDPTQVLRDYADYMTYSLSTQGHLNADGLCYVKRNYPSPH